MGREFDLQLNFPVSGLDNIDSADQKLQQLAATIDNVANKIGTIGRSTSQSMAATIQAVNQATRSTTQQAIQAAQQAAQQATQAAQQAARQATAAAQQSTGAYNHLLQTIQAANRAMNQTPRRGVGLGGGGTGGGGGFGGGGGTGGHGFGGGMTASHPRVAFFQALGLGAGGYMGFEVLKRVAEDIKQVVEEATRGAVELRNFASSMGVSVQQAQELRNAAKLSGVEIGTLETALRTLSSALEDPAGAGKKASEALRQLGVETTNLKGELRDPGQIAVELVAKLHEVGDAAKQDYLGVATLGRGFKELVPLIKEWDSAKGSGITDSFKETNDELVKAHENITRLKLVFEEMGRSAVAGVAPAIQYVADLLTKMQPMGGGKNYGQGNVSDPSRLPGDFNQFGYDGKGQWSKLSQFHYAGNGLGIHFADNGAAKQGKDFEWNTLSVLQARERELKRQADTDANSIYSLYHSGKNPDGSLLDKYKQEQAESKKYADRIKQLEKLDHPGKGKTDLYPEALARLRDRVGEIIDGDKGPLARFDEQMHADERRFNLKPFSPRWLDFMSQAGIVRNDIVGQQQEHKEYRTERQGEKLDTLLARMQEQAAKKSAEDIVNGLREGDVGAEFLWKPGSPTSLPPGWSTKESADLGRLMAGGVNRLNSTLSGPGQEGQTAANNLNLSLREIEAQQQKAIELAKVLDDEKQLQELEKARFDAAKSGLEAVLRYEEEIANIRRQQLQETRQFTSGLFESLISGKPGATANFFKGYAHQWADTIVGNFGAQTIGTLNSRLTLQSDTKHDGVLGHYNQKTGQLDQSWLGKVLSGTPFGVDPAKGGTVDPLKIATDSNTDSTKDNSVKLDSLSQSVRDLVGVMGRMSGIDTSGLPGMSAAPSAASSPPSVNPNHSAMTPVLKSAMDPLTGAVQHLTKATQQANRQTSNDASDAAPLPARGTPVTNPAWYVGGNLYHDGPVQRSSSASEKDEPGQYQIPALAAPTNPSAAVEKREERPSAASEFLPAPRPPAPVIPVPASAREEQPRVSTASSTNASAAADHTQTHKLLRDVLGRQNPPAPSAPKPETRLLPALETGASDATEPQPRASASDAGAAASADPSRESSRAAGSSSSHAAAETERVLAAVLGHPALRAAEGKPTSASSSPGVPPTPVESVPVPSQEAYRPAPSVEPEGLRPADPRPVPAPPAAPSPGTASAANPFLAAFLRTSAHPAPAEEKRSPASPRLTPLSDETARPPASDASRPVRVVEPESTSPAPGRPAAPAPPAASDQLSSLLGSQTKPLLAAFLRSPALPASAEDKASAAFSVGVPPVPVESSPAPSDEAYRPTPAAPPETLHTPAARPAAPAPAPVAAPASPLPATAPHPVVNAALRNTMSSLSAVSSLLSGFHKGATVSDALRGTQQAGSELMRVLNPGLHGTPPFFPSRTAPTVSLPPPQQNTSVIPAINPSSTFDWLTQLVGGPGGTSGTFGRVNLASGANSQDAAVPMTTDNPAEGGKLYDLSGTRLPDLGLAPGSPLSAAVGDPAKAGPSAPDTAMSTAQEAQGFTAKLGQILGGTKYGTSGYGLEAVFDGQDQKGNDLSGSQRVGAALGMAAQTTGGILAAISGFGKGGAKGTIQGIAGAAEAIAPFTGPAAPFLEAGGAIMGLVSSLFPDPREARRNDEAEKLTHNAFVAPAAREYDFAAGSTGGFSMGMGSSLHAGGPSANYSITIHALDAQSVVNWAQNNPQSAAQFVLAGIGQGGLPLLDQEIAWRSQNGQSVPNNWGKF